MSWTSKDEIEFLNKLGSHSTKLAKTPRLILLKTYRQTCEARIDWNHINKKELIATLDRLIQNEEKKEI